MEGEKNKNNKETLNKEAKEFIPTKNRIPEKLKFNENAKEYNTIKFQKRIKKVNDNIVSDDISLINTLMNQTTSNFNN